MHRSDFFTFSINHRDMVFVSQYIENLFARWSLEEVYLGNVDLCFSALFQLLLPFSPSDNIRVQVSLGVETLVFVLNGVGKEVLTFIENDYGLDDLLDKRYKSVFLIKKLSDEIKVKNDFLLLKFNMGALPYGLLPKKNHLIHSTNTI